MPIVATIVIFPFVVLAAVIWAFLGLFFWIPLIAKSVTVFTFSVLAQAIVDRPSVTAVANLEKAILYYPKGFIIIFRTLNVSREEYRTSQEGLDSPFSLFSSLLESIGKILGMCLFAFIFWFMLFLFLGHLGIVQVGVVKRIQEYWSRGASVSETPSPEVATPLAAEPAFQSVAATPALSPPAETRPAAPPATVPPPTLTQLEIDGLRAQIQPCWRLPTGSSDGIVVIRLALKADGFLAGDPVLVEAGASRDGPALVQAATRAIKECQPYRLPIAKYPAWKVLEVAFDPRTFVRAPSKDGVSRPLSILPDADRLTNKGTK